MQLVELSKHPQWPIVQLDKVLKRREARVPTKPARRASACTHGNFVDI